MKLLNWLRLTDDDGLLSLTHLSLFIALGLLIAGRPISLPEFATFVAALGSYRVKRALENRDDSATTDSRLTQLEADVKKLGSPERLLALRDQLKGGGGGRT